VSSNYAAGEVVRELGLARERVHVCSPGTPSWATQVSARQAAARGGRILFLGTLGLRKNVGTLLEAYARLVARRPDAPPLILAGRQTPDAARWIARAQDPPLAGRVEFTGYVDAAKRIELFADARMLILPSYEEGFGLPVLEAMACGVPVVISSRGSLPEVAGPAADPVNPDDADGFAARMEALLDDRTADAASERGRARAAHYSWSHCAHAARETYRAAVEVHAHRR
jgi:alpha-1,3-rhamnosyl/mannosyltransferase